LTELEAEEAYRMTGLHVIGHVVNVLGNSRVFGGSPAAEAVLCTKADMLNERTKELESLVQYVHIPPCSPLSDCDAKVLRK
jgi:hypothetical protein